MSVIFTGCSYTAGTGLPLKSQDPDLWVNRLHNQVSWLRKLPLLNCGQGGATNQDIFRLAVQAVTQNQCNLLFVAWTDLLRYYISPGVETWSTTQFWSPNSSVTDIGVNPGIVYSASYLENIKNRFFDLHHIHYEIVKVLNYTFTLQQLCDRLGVQVYFINSLLPWDEKYFDQVTGNRRQPSDTTTLTQQSLNSNSRDDKDFFELYDRIHQDYQNTQALPAQCKWLNLYQSYREHFYLDRGLDNLHPGPVSNQAFADFLHKKVSDYHPTR
jgi:hypothetical protein